MPATVFISYAHADEKVLDRLHKHLTMLLRDGTLDTWTDHKILPGDGIQLEINTQLERSDIFLPLVSPDYLASNYCYDKEFQAALSRARDGKMRIVPVVVEPCDWLSSPLSEFMALPKDGKAISEFTNVNNAYLEVVNGLRRVLATGRASHTNEPNLGEERSEAARKVRVKKDFDSIEKAQFADRAFQIIQEYFFAACMELEGASEDLRTSAEVMSPTAFTASLVNRAKVGHRESHITIRNNKMRSYNGEISYLYERHGQTNSANGFIRVDADDYNLFLRLDSFHSTRDDAAKYTPERAAEWLWAQFVAKAGVEYE